MPMIRPKTARLLPNLGLAKALRLRISAMAVMEQNNALHALLPSQFCLWHPTIYQHGESVRLRVKPGRLSVFSKAVMVLVQAALMAATWVI